MTDKIVTVKVRVPADSNLDAALKTSSLIVKSGCRSCRIVGIEEAEPEQEWSGVERRELQRPTHPGSFILAPEGAR